MYLVLEDLLKLFLALLLGGIIGFEREIHAKAAGLRTITLITVGATLFAMLSSRFSSGDPSRIASNIVVGVGFLGAGAIMYSEGRIHGLTTASSIWASAAIGLGIGLGQYVLVGAFGAAVIVVLWGFTRFDRWLEGRGGVLRHYEMRYDSPKKFRDIEHMFEKCELKIRSAKRLKRDDLLVSQWDVDGKPSAHAEAIDLLLNDKEIRKLDY